MLQLRAAIRERGSSHIRCNTPCQDQFLVAQNETAALFTLADGHGSAPYTRSGLGARMMCAAARQVLLAENAITQPDQALAAALKDTYDHLVARHMQFRPLAQWEKARLETRPPEQAYGCTFLAVLSTEQETLCCQVGDGHIALLDPCATFLPSLASDSACMGNVTSSMAYEREDCLNHFRLRRYPHPVAALLMYSDGYAHPGLHPYAAAGLLAMDPSISMEQILSEGRHGDDLTFLLAADPRQTAAEAFQSCLPRTVYRGALLLQAGQLKTQLQSSECYLQLALKQIHTAADPKKAAALTEQLRPRAKAYQAALQTYQQLQQELSC